MVDAGLRELAGRMVMVPGVVAVVLGGSRARGEHTATSDVDLGLYYRPPLDVGALARLAHQVSGPQAEVTEPGAWGPWVDGGAWLTIDGTAVDWLYRDLDRVHQSWSDAQSGRCLYHVQVGHPFGVPDVAYAGELALGVVLADPTGEVTALQEQTQRYPPLLTATFRQGLWEADFLVKAAAKGLPRADTTYVAGCLFRAVQLCAAALHGQARRWLVNEKGAVWSANRLPGAPRDFGSRAHAVLGGLGTTEAELARALTLAAELVADTVVACPPDQTVTRPSAGTDHADIRD